MNRDLLKSQFCISHVKREIRHFLQKIVGSMMLPDSLQEKKKKKNVLASRGKGKKLCSLEAQEEKGSK